MLKFMRGKSHHLTAERLKLHKELFSFVKTTTHGFPHRPSALAWDAKLQLLAIGTKNGLIRIYGAPGVEFEGKHKEETCVVELFFLPGQGRLISQCDNSSLHLFELNEKEGKWTLEEVKFCSLQGRLKKITTCCLPTSGENLLIGTDGGNIYLLDVKSFEMTDHIIYQDIVIQNVPDDYKLNPGSVEAIAEHPLNPDKIIIGYNRGLMVLWDNKTLNSENTYVGSQQLESLSWHRSGTKFISSHNDGTYVVWSSTDASKPEESPATPYGPFPCKAISKILWRAVKGGDDFTIFAGGMPRASFGDKHTVTVMCGEKHQVFDFTSRVVDFFTICHGDEESEYDNPHTLVVLAEEEIVLIDLESEDWLPFRLPHLSSLHMSSITCTQHCTDVPQDIWNSIITAGNKSVAEKYTEKEWPIMGGENLVEKSSTHNLLLTGHEDGSVRFWDASGVALSHLYTLHTSNLFVSEEGEPPAEEEEWPPFRKVGSFDPYSDDPRLAVKKILLCVHSKTLVVAGTAGQIVFFELKEDEIEQELEAHPVNIVSDRDNFVWKGHDQLSLKSGSLKFESGFVPVSIEQLTPPAAVTAIALHTQWGLVAAGTAHGFALFDYVQKKAVMSKCTLNPNDLIATGDAAMSRKKSFKKSLRQSFRRLRKGRSQRGKRDKTPTREEAKTPVKESTPENDAATPITETKPVERQVEARSADDSMGSMVRCLYLAQSFIINNALQSHTLWAGTNAGAIYVFTISMHKDNRKSEPITCQLGKEIQLKHRAPVIAIQILDSLGHPLPDPYEVEKNRAKTPDVSGNHRVIICSEEQFKVFTLPSLKPYCKFKLTAHEGSRVRKVAMIKFVSKSDENYSEDCMTCLSNQGEISIFTVPDLRRQQVHNCLKREDINGISSVVFTKTGQAFYLHSPCEFQRFTLSARDILEAKCKIDLPEGSRPPLTVTETSDNTEKPEEEKEVKETNEEKPTEQEKAVDVAAAMVESLQVKDEEKPDQSESKIEANTSQDESKGELDITVDSVKDHLTNTFTEGLTSVVEKVESSKVAQETITKVSSTVISTKETIVNAKEIVVSTTENAKETVINATETAKQTFMNSTENAKNSLANMKSSAVETITNTTETIVNSTSNACGVVKGDMKELQDNPGAGNAILPSLNQSSSKNKAPTADLEEFNHIDEVGV